jgi:hypothetical protein
MNGTASSQNRKPGRKRSSSRPVLVQETNSSRLSVEVTYKIQENQPQIFDTEPADSNTSFRTLCMKRRNNTVSIEYQMDLEERLVLRRRLDWRSACLFMVADPAWKRKIWVGGWVLLIPVIGWPAILGYRKDAIVRLVDGASPLLPDWRAGLWCYFKEGFKALLVINAWFLPAMIWVSVLLAQSPQSAEFPWLWLIAFFLAAPIFSTLAVPALLLIGRYALTEPAISVPELLGIYALFASATFVIPAGFLNVSRTGSFLSAFDVVWLLRTIWRNFAAYLEAWIGSGITSLIGHGCVPFSPWGIVWAYLSIVYFFNEVPTLKDQQDNSGYLEDSWFPVMRSNFWTRFEVQEKSGTQRYIADCESEPAHDSLSPRSFTAIALGPVSVPIK